MRHTILLVEDNLDDVLLMRRAFRKAGLTADLAVVNDGDAAVAYLSGAPPHDDRSAHPLPSLVLLDLKLPRRNGFEVLEWARGRSGLGGVPIVVLTSSAESVDVARAYAQGAASYLVKPVAAEGVLALAGSLGLSWLRMGPVGGG